MSELVKAYKLTEKKPGTYQSNVESRYSSVHHRDRVDKQRISGTLALHMIFKLPKGW